MHAQRTAVILAILVSLTVSTSGRAAIKSTGVPRFDEAVNKAIRHMQAARRISDRDKTLVGYALHKAGVEQTDPLVSDAIELARTRALEANYDAYAELYLAAIDAMLLADAGGSQYRAELQSIADLIIGHQRDDGVWAAPEFNPGGSGDCSLTQYCILGLWAARRGGCRISPGVFDRAAMTLIDNLNPDGGWSYRLTGDATVEESSHTMTLAAVASIAICRRLLTGASAKSEKDGPFGGVLKRKKEDTPQNTVGYPDYSARMDLDEAEHCIQSGIGWTKARYGRPLPKGMGHIHLHYYYYSLERGAALAGLDGDWYEMAGDRLLELQKADGAFDEPDKPYYGPAICTGFAILYYMRSTQQILDYGRGLQVGARDLVEFVNPRARAKKPVGPLDELLAAMEGQDFSNLDVDTEEVIDRIQFSSRDELIGQADMLKKLVKSPDPDNRQIAYWALSRTGDFDLIPLMLDGLQDESLSVNVEAVAGLRYISRQPKGIGLTLDPLGGLAPGADDAARANAASVWRDKAERLWRGWYSKVRPYRERDGLDEIGLPID